MVMAATMSQKMGWLDAAEVERVRISKSDGTSACLGLDAARRFHETHDC